MATKAEDRVDIRTGGTAIRARADDAKRYWLEEGWSEGGFVRTVDYTSNARGVDPLFAGIKIVDCDTRFTEPADLWTSNAPAGMKEVEMTDGSLLPLVTSPARFDAKSVTPRRAPELGEHTETTLVELGLAWDEVSALKDRGVIG